MTGKQILAIREALGMNRSLFARLMQVDQRTVSRWEAAEDVSKLNLFHVQLLAALEAEIRDIDNQKFVEVLSRRITTGLQVHGNLYGLHLLLRWVFRSVKEKDA